MEKLIEEITNVYEAKIARYKEEGIDFTEIERMVLLRNIDTKWIDHIDSMDQLRKGISLRGYGQVDPVVEYKKEGFEMFEDITASIQDDTITLLLKAEIQKVPQPVRNPLKDMQTNQTGPAMPRKAKQEIGRNDPCPCGSGIKYKNCCGKHN
jgi:preprotein translocase subunit SecA